MNDNLRSYGEKRARPADCLDLHVLLDIIRLCDQLMNTPLFKNIEAKINFFSGFSRCVQVLKTPPIQRLNPFYDTAIQFRISKSPGQIFLDPKTYIITGSI
jgi:hypothetical protein